MEALATTVDDDLWTANEATNLHDFVPLVHKAPEQRSRINRERSGSFFYGKIGSARANDLEYCDLSLLWIEAEQKWDLCASKYSQGETSIDHSLLTSVAFPSQSVLDLEAQFNERAERWERESSIHSSPGAKFLHKDYISIIAKGESVVPLILKRLKHSKKDWIWALEHIVEDDQNPPKNIHNFKDAAKAWLEWGQKRYNLN